MKLRYVIWAQWCLIPTSQADGEIDHEKLRDTIRIAIRALDNVIDVNYYPTEAAKTSNMRHRPIGMGVMGLQNSLLLRMWRSIPMLRWNLMTSSWKPFVTTPMRHPVIWRTSYGTYSSYRGSAGSWYFTSGYNSGTRRRAWRKSGCAQDFQNGLVCGSARKNWQGYECVTVM